MDHSSFSARRGAALILMLAAAGSASSGTIDLATPEGANLAQRRIQCSMRDNVPITYYWNGDAFSRVAGEPDRKLFRVEGMNIRQCGTVTDPVRGKGWRLVSRELLLYLDPVTGEVLKTWQNPWTGKTVNVIQTANDPVNQRPVFAIGANGQPAKWTGQSVGDYWWMTSTVPLFYKNPLGGDYQDFVGGTYHATEMFNFMGSLSDLTDDSRDTAAIRVGWVRLSRWLPWMEMGDRDGLIYFHTAGRKLDSFDQMPAVMRNEIARNYPAYTAPPPVDDTRPNETSWTYFMKKVPAGKPPATH